MTPGFAKIPFAVWRSPGFRGVTAASRLFYLWLLTTQTISSNGRFFVYFEQAEVDLNMSLYAVCGALKELANAHLIESDVISDTLGKVKILPIEKGEG